MAGPVNTLPEAMDGPSLVHAAGRSLSHVGHAGHLSGCLLTATHPLCGLRSHTMKLTQPDFLHYTAFNHRQYYRDLSSDFE